MMELDDDLNPVAEILGDLHFGSLMYLLIEEDD